MRASSFSIINCYFGGLKLVLGKKTTLGLLQLSNLASTCSSFSESEVFSSEDTENSISEETDNLQLENHNWVSSEDESDDFYVGECSSSKTLKKMKEDGVKGEDIDNFPLENHNWVSSEDESDDDSSVGECSTSKTLKMTEDGVKGIKSILMNHGYNLDFGHGQKIDELKFIRILNDLFDGSSNAAIALNFFRWSESCSGYKHTIRTVCTMIHILVSGNMNHIAVDLIRYLVTNNYGSEEWHHLVFNVLKETHRDSRVLVTVYSMLVNSYIRENIIHMALLLINQMKILHIYPTIGVCNSLLRALLNSNQIESALEVLKEIHNRGMVNASIMSLFIHHYCAEGSIESACKMLVEMVNFGCKPDVVAYTIVINALCKMGHLRKATAIFFKMICMGVPADSVSVTSVIDGYCKARRLEEAMNVLKISCIRSNVFVYNSFISELCRGGKMIEATRLFHEMFELGIQPDCCSYTTIIQGYCKVDDLVIALMYLGEMVKRGFRPVIVTYTVLVESYCKIGNLEMAEKVFSMVRRDGLKPDVVMYNTLMNGYGKNDHSHKAYELLDMMRHADVSPDAATYNTIIHDLARRGFVKEAINILEELTTRKDFFSMDILTITNLIAGFSKTRSCEEACHIWSRMSKHEHGIKPDVVAYSALIHSYCMARRMEEAKTRFREMLEAGLDPDIILYNTLINGFCNIGNIAEACRLVRRMVEQGIIPNHVTYRALVHAFEKEMVEKPAENAAIWIQKILLEYGINVDVSQYIYMERQSFS